MNTCVAIVEDDADVLDAVKTALEQEGWCVWTYATGEAFLEDLCAHRRPDCLILDPHLPGISGAEVARSVKKTQGDVPIVGLSARPESPVGLHDCRTDAAH